MAQALDSSYIWGINPQNYKNLSADQRMGLMSLVPQNGLGLTQGPNRAALNPMSQLPTPQFSPDAASYTAEFAPTSRTQEVLTANVNPTEKPYFDPNYPYESMLALKNWLAPQVAKGAEGSMNARGLGYSGTGAASKEVAQNYLDTLAPTGENGQQALANDFNYLYGPNLTNSLVSGRPGSNPGGRFGVNIPPINPSIPGATEFGGGGTNAAAELMYNPNFSGSFTPEPGVGIPESPGHMAPAPSPLFGLYDRSTGNSYGGPGYQYDPNNMPDVSRMPWLHPATPYSGA